MSLAFFKTKVGAALIVAALLIIAAVGARFAKESGARSGLADKIDLIADSSVRQGIEKGQLDWEKSLKLLDSPANTTADAASGAYASSTSSEITATDRFARELFTLYAQAKKNGQSIDEATAQKIADLALSNDYAGQMKESEVSDLNVSTDTSRAAAKSYGNSLGKALSVPPAASESELLILDRIINGNSTPDDTESLVLIYKRYKTMIDALRYVRVPQDAVTAHLDLLNGLSYIARAVEGMLSMETDPIGSLTKVKAYEDGVDLMTSGGLSLRSYFAAKNISFSSDESGYKFVR